MAEAARVFSTQGVRPTVARICAALGGERISTGFAESSINQVLTKRFVKKQQMRWTERGAHLLLQVGVNVFNYDLHRGSLR